VIANTATLYAVYELVLEPIFEPESWIPLVAAKVMAIVTSFIVNFSLAHFVVFRTR
jgi:putative flippase GtrA